MWLWRLTSIQSKSRPLSLFGGTGPDQCYAPSKICLERGYMGTPFIDGIARIYCEYVRATSNVNNYLTSAYRRY